MLTDKIPSWLRNFLSTSDGDLQLQSDLDADGNSINKLLSLNSETVENRQKAILKATSRAGGAFNIGPPREQKPLALFTLDDGWQSQYDERDIFSSNNIKPLLAVETANLGTTGRMSWSQCQELYNGLDWEITNHGKQGLGFDSDSLTEDEIIDEVYGGYQDLLDHDIMPGEIYTYVFGQTGDQAGKAIVSELYNGAFTADVAEPWNSARPWNIGRISMENNTTTGIKSMIDNAETNNNVVILMAHEIETGSDTSRSKIQEIINYINGKSNMEWTNSRQLLKSRVPFSVGDKEGGGISELHLSHQGLNIKELLTPLTRSDTGAFLSQAGSNTWKERTYKGFEVINTTTTYTIGSGQAYTSIYNAIEDLQDLILTEDLTLELRENIEETNRIIPKGLVSAGGKLIIELQSYIWTLNNSHSSGIMTPYDSLYIQVHGDGSGSGATFKCGANISNHLAQVDGCAFLEVREIDVDANNQSIRSLAEARRGGEAYWGYDVTTSNVGSLTEAPLTVNGGRIACRSSVGSVQTSGYGGMIIRADGTVVT